MTKQTFIFIIAIFPVFILSAQPTITEAVVFSVGDQATVYFDNTEFEPGDAGENVTWDFSSFMPENNVTWQALDPQETSFLDSFPGATLAFQLPPNSLDPFPVNALSYYTKVGNSFQYLGTATHAEGSSETNFFTVTQDSDELYQFPISYGDSYTDDIYGTNTLTASGMQFSADRSGTTSTTVDGYGTLITPAGTFNNVLRVERIEDIVDQLGPVQTNQEIVRYDWLSPDHLYILYHTEEIIIRDAFGNEQSRTTNSYYSDPEIINGVKKTQKTLALTVFPNPTTDFIQVKTTDLESANYSYQITNTQGQIVKQGHWSQNDNAINLKTLSGGMYQLKISNGTQSWASQFVKK